MLKRMMVIRTLLLSCIIGVFGLVYTAENAAEENTKNKVTISWKEFKNILKLDKDEITLSEDNFQKLLAQTGVKTAPNYTVKGGKVVLTREEFRKLLDKMKPVVDPGMAPPADYLITKAQYNARMRKENTYIQPLV